MKRNYSYRGASDSEKEIFAERLNYFIAKSNKSQAQVAKELGYSPTTLNTWCKGGSMPTSGKIQKIADYFNVGKSALTEAEPSPYAYRSGTDDAKLLFNFNLLSEENKKLVLELIEKLLPR